MRHFDNKVNFKQEFKVFMTFWLNNEYVQLSPWRDQ